METEVETKTAQVGYIRVSSVDDRQKLGFEAQRRILKDYGVDFLFAEKQSGRRDDRIEFNRAVNKATRLAKAGVKVSFVVYKLDRLGRKALTLLKVFQQFEDSGIKFVSIHEGIDTSTPTGKLMLQLLSIFSELEVNNISERTKLGLEQARRDGKVIGRPKTDTKTRNKVIRLYQTPTLRVADVARRCRISEKTVYEIAREEGLSRRGKTKEVPKI